MGYTCSLAGMSSLGRSGRYIHTAETRPTADPTGNRGGCPRKQIPEKTERAAETDRPLGFRLWETAMENRSRNPMGNRGLVSALCTNGWSRGRTARATYIRYQGLGPTDLDFLFLYARPRSQLVWIGRPAIGRRTARGAAPVLSVLSSGQAAL